MAGIGKAGEPKFQSMGISENCQLIVQVSEELAWGIRALKGEAKCGYFTLQSYPFWLKGKKCKCWMKWIWNKKNRTIIKKNFFWFPSKV